MFDTFDNARGIDGRDATLIVIVLTQDMKKYEILIKMLRRIVKKAWKNGNIFY